MARAKGDAGGTDGTPLDFEQSMKRLETIVEELEAGELSLEDSIARYEEGIQLSRRLTKVLDESEKRIERLVEKEGQAPATEPMELSSLREGAREPFEGELPLE
jgi:exodeoxyribonuclease VII small subunit